MPDDCATIGDAIAAASDGDDIVVSGGPYVESVFVYKRVTLTGTGMPVVDGSGGSYVFKITVNGVTLQGFNVTNAGYGIWVTSNNNTIRGNKAVAVPYCGIKMNYAGGNNVTGNDVSRMTSGIQLFMSDFNNVTGNNASYDTGIGIQLYTSSRNNVSGNNACYAGQTGVQLTESSDYNNVTGNVASHAGVAAGNGIDLESSSHSLVSGNTLDSNYRYGILVYGGTLNNVSFNVATGNYEGIRVDSADHVSVTGNLASLTDTGNGCGIHLSGATWCNVSGNTASHNTWGIEVSGGNHNNVTGNTASSNDANNGVGIYVYGTGYNVIADNAICGQRTGLYFYNANNNVIWSNLVTGNAYRVGFDSGSQNRWNSTATVTYLYGGQKYTGYAGNVWGGYAGADTNGDGIGDTPCTVATGNIDNYPLMAANYPLALTEPDAVPSGGAVKNLRTGLNYTTIQAAVDAAVTGDTILVGKGTYVENVLVNKALNLTGLGLPVVDAANSGEGFYVSADHVTVRGFNVTHASSGIKVAKSYCNVTGNVVNGSEYGIYLDSGASHNNVTGNTACHSGSSGISLADGANYNNVTGNFATSNDNGIELYSARHNVIAGNNVSGNGVGLDLYDTSNCEVEDNLIDGCGDQGIHLNYVTDNNVTENVISRNPAGIYGYAAYHILYVGNTFTDNDNAIYLESSGQSNFTMNVLTCNGVGIRFTASSESVLWLNVLDNTVNAQRDSISANRWNSTQPVTYSYDGHQYTNYLGNRWSDYAGADANGDGIGDTSHATGPESARVTDNYPLLAAVHEEPDTTPPSTTAQISGMPGNAGWYRDTVEVELTTGEPGDTATIYYLVDTTAGPWNVYHGIFYVGNGTHTVRYYSVDAAGNPETPKSVNVNVDLVAPQVQSVTPSGGQTGVATDATVTIAFSEYMDPSTISAAGLTLKNAADQAIAGTVSYDAAARMATFTPSAALSAGTTYHIAVSGPCDIAGNPLAAPYSSTFTTLVLPVDDAEYVSSAPAHMLSGSHGPANITMRNTGNTVWSDEAGYELKIMGITIPVGDGMAVQPGEEHQFNFTWTADVVEYDTDMSYGCRMQQDGDMFGQTGYWHVTIDALVPDAAFVSATPSTMVSGYHYKVNITMRNTGNTVWSDAEGYDLKVMGIKTGIGDGKTVLPGEEHTFTFEWTADDVTQDTVMDYGCIMENSTSFFGQLGYWHVTIEACKPDAAYVAGSPSAMIGGNQYQANITMRNTGNTVWTDADGYALKIMGITVPVGDGIAVQPGYEHKFNFTWTADDVSQDTDMDYGCRMQQDGDMFGQTGYWHITINARVPNAVYVSGTPSAMIAGNQYKVNITMRNTGDTAWTAADGYALKIVSVSAPIGSGRTVQPGEEYTFTFDWTADDVGQDTDMNYGCRMFRGSTGFGQSGMWPVTIYARVNDAEYVSGSPARMVSNIQYQANVTMRNTGNTAWTDADGYALKVGSITVPVGDGVSVQPGEEHKFNFTWTADDVDTTGDANYACRMEKGGTGFGPICYWGARIYACAEDAGYVSGTPAEMVGNHQYRANITVRNTGYTAWTDADGYALKVANVTIPVGAGKTVQPGEEYTFSFSWTAENLSVATDRFYSCRMQKDGTGFGQAGIWQVRVSPPVLPKVHVVISGVLTYLGTPVEGATISGVDGNYPDYGAGCATDAYGRYTLDIGSAGHGIITFNMSYGGHERSVQYETPLPWQTNPTGYYYVNNWNFEITDPSSTLNPTPSPTPAPTPVPTPDPSLPGLHLMLSGTVSYGGMPVQGATVTGTDADYAGYRGQGTTDTYGRYLIDIGSAPYHTITFEIRYDGHALVIQEQMPATWSSSPASYVYINNWNFDIPVETPAPSWLTAGSNRLTVSGNTITAPTGTDLSQYLNGGRLTAPAGSGTITVDVAAAAGSNTGTVTGVHVGGQAEGDLGGARATVSAFADLKGLPADNVTFDVSVVAPTQDRIAAASDWLAGQGRTITGTPLAVVEVDKSGITNADLVGGTARFTLTMAKPADFDPAKHYGVIRHGEAGYEELTATITGTTETTVTFEIVSPNGFSVFIIAGTADKAIPTASISPTPVPAPGIVLVSLALIGGAMIGVRMRGKGW